VEKWRKLIHAKKGFTLVELIVVVIILLIITVASMPGFLGSLRKGQFEKNIVEIVTLLDRARTQALASKLDSSDKISSGGYGVFFDMLNQEAVLFVDDWNAAAGEAVNVDYAFDVVASRVLSDGIYTPGHDTALSTLVVDSPSYILLESLSGYLLDGSAWSSAPGNTITVIFKPPYAEAIITGNPGAVSLQNFDAVFRLISDKLTRTIKFNRVTTAPQVIKN
jgi:prepilin-type N-terminal cleavage/methylation domain-containing protein